MRHLNSGSKLGKQPAHRRAVLRSLVTNLFEHGRITTTLTRAKAARPVAEKMITLGKRDTLQSRRMAASYIMLPAVTQKLFSEIAPKFADRAGGYTRIIHAGNRVGDNAKVAILELVGYEFKLKEKKEKPKKEETAEVKSSAPVPNSSSAARSSKPERAFCLSQLIGEWPAAESRIRQKGSRLPLFPLPVRIAASGTTSTARRRRRKRRSSRAGNRKPKRCGWRRMPGEFHPG